MKIVSHQENTFIEFKVLPEISACSFKIAACLSSRKVTYGDKREVTKNDEVLVDPFKIVGDSEPATKVGQSPAASS